MIAHSLCGIAFGSAALLPFCLLLPVTTESKVRPLSTGDPTDWKKTTGKPAALHRSCSQVRLLLHEPLQLELDILLESCHEESMSLPHRSNIIHVPSKVGRYQMWYMEIDVAVSISFHRRVQSTPDPPNLGAEDPRP